MLTRFSIPLVSTLALALSLAPQSADAHSWMLVPKPTFPENFYLQMSPFARIDGESFAGAASVPSYKGPEKIAAAITSSGAKTLRQFVMDNMNVTMTDAVKMPTKECGMSQASGARQPVPDAVDFPWAHPGPCEIWCDNTRLFYNDNCSGNSVGKVTIDKAKCAGASFLQGMYVGTHVPNWEVYVNCAPLEGGSSTDAAAVFKTTAAAGSASSGGASDSSASTSPAPAATTVAPANDADEYDEPKTTTAPSIATPTATTAKPTATTAAPSKKPSCAKRRRN